MPSKRLFNDDDGADDALSLHTTPDPEPYHDDIVDDDAPQIGDLPPAYSDDLRPARDPFQGELRPLPVSDSNNNASYYILKRLDADPGFLEQAVGVWAKPPPRLAVRMRGTHKKSVDNGKKREEVVDFDVKVYLTPYLYTDARRGRSWTHVRTVENTEKAYRGTIFQRRAPGAKQDIEVGGGEKPTVKEWCHRYCASHAKVRSFRVTRKVTGLDKKLMKSSLERLIRDTGYKGSLQILFPIEDEAVEVYSDTRINHWRLTTWICWIFYLTLLFIFTWPILYFSTKRWEVVTVEWQFSRIVDDEGRKEYVSISEESWLSQWNRAIYKAVMAKRQCVLDEQDLLQSHQSEPEINTGNRTVDGAVGFLAAGVNAYREVNRQLGWGHDC